MGTLYIDRKDLHIRLDGHALAFYSNDKREGVVPINPLKRVVMVGNITIETPVLHRLTDEGISVLFLSGKRLRFRGMVYGRLHYNGILRVKQYEKSLTEFNKDTSLEIVRRKIEGQKDFLLSARESRPELRFPMTRASGILEKILKTLNSQKAELENLRGYEGSASAAYFSAYTKLFPESLQFKRRNRRPPEDTVNAMLSLCYTLLHYEIVREIEVIGLDPTIGFYHQFEYGRESLACDLVELYRTDVDRFVWELFRERVFTVRDFSQGDERPGCYLKKESRTRFYPLYEEWAKDLRPKLVNEVRTLATRIMDGQDVIPE
jgi:CRISPR-associated protein Cas1